MHFYKPLGVLVALPHILVVRFLRGAILLALALLLRPLGAPQVLIEEHDLLLVGVECTSARELILA